RSLQRTDELCCLNLTMKGSNIPRTSGKIQGGKLAPVKLEERHEKIRPLRGIPPGGYPGYGHARAAAARSARHAQERSGGRGGQAAGPHPADGGRNLQLQRA